jgi:hypothetical protein
MLLRIVMIVAIPLIAFAAFGWHGWLTDLLHTKHAITEPQTIGAYSVVASPQLVSLEAAMSQQLATHGATQSVIAAYSNGVAPQALLILSKGAFRSESPTQALAEFSREVGNHGLTVSAQTTDTRADGTDFLCSAVSSPSSTGSLSICFWDDYDVLGMVIALTPLPGNAYSLAVRARALGEH